MVLSKQENPIFDIKISTVGPGYVSGQGAVQELTGLDLAMKLHYIRTVYYFPSQAFEGMTIINIKETMFYWMNHAYIPCGRFRKSESDRPYIKCNDCGVRLIEARCNMSLDEWLESRDDARHKLVVPSQGLGPDLLYSPLVLMQTDVSVEELSPMELGLLIMNQAVNETKIIEEAMEPDNELPDFIVYGANLTFVDLHDAPIYDLNIRGHKPVYVNCAIDHVGDEGVMLVFPSRKVDSDGVMVSITLPENHISDVRSMLKKEWSLC